MNVVRYEPWSLLRRLHDDVNRLWTEGHFPLADDSDETLAATSRWSPAVDIKEEADRYLITADVPGVDPKAIEITMQNGTLTLKGERAEARKDDRDGYRRVERVKGTFYRRFTLPDSADADRINAKAENGVLEVSIPKQEKAQPRRIQVAA